MSASVFAAVFVALFVAHSVGDHWVQTHHQSLTKGAPGWGGRLADTRHVATLTTTKAAVLTPVALLLHLHLSVLGLVLGLGLDAASHWWADRRSTLVRLAHALGKSQFYELGSTTVDGNGERAFHIGTGAYALDQSFHLLWLLIGSLIIATV
jgi:hypothetical protein